MKIEELKKYKKILIAGYGKEGEVTERFLKQYVPDAVIGITDIKDGLNYLDKQDEYDLVFRTPGVKKELLKGSYTTGTNIFFANVSNITIGVTGTKGKSTTASLICEILKDGGKKVRLVGNIGKPMIGELLREIDQGEVFVCELSSYQLDDIRYTPHISVIVSLFPEHMNYHGSVTKYYEAKKNIITHAKQSDYFVYNPRFPELLKWANTAVCKAVPFIKRVPFEVVSNLIGQHNQDNIRGAVTVAKILNIPDDIVKKSLQHFRPLPHRLQFVGEYKDIMFYDDAISTTPESTIAAIEALENIGTLFLGGLDRGYDFELLTSKLKQFKIQNIVLFPDSGAKIKKLIKKGLDYNPLIFETDNMKEAVKFAYKNTPQKSICLLSNASPSYSIWKNFEEKGDEFQKYVKILDHGRN